MSLFLVTGPTTEPLSVDEAKAQYRFEVPDEDELVLALIKAANGHTETFIHRKTLTQTLSQKWPPSIFINDLNAPSVRERQLAADKAKIEETEHAQKIEHAPSDPAPDQTPGGPTCLTTEQSD